MWYGPNHSDARVNEAALVNQLNLVKVKEFFHIFSRFRFLHIEKPVTPFFFNNSCNLLPFGSVRDWIWRWNLKPFVLLYIIYNILKSLYSLQTWRNWNTWKHATTTARKIIRIVYHIYSLCSGDDMLCTKNKIIFFFLVKRIKSTKYFNLSEYFIDSQNCCVSRCNSSTLPHKVFLLFQLLLLLFIYFS